MTVTISNAFINNVAGGKEPPTLFGEADQERGNINCPTTSSFKNTKEDFFESHRPYESKIIRLGHCGIRSFERQRRASTLRTNFGDKLHFGNKVIEGKII